MCTSAWRIHTRSPGGKEGDAFIGFSFGYVFNIAKDLKKEAAGFPEGVALCSSPLFAGKEHVEWILRQAAESWAASLPLAKNRSIDLLMRISCQRQIARALQASGLGQISEIVVFGLARSKESLNAVEVKLAELGGIRKDQIIDLDEKKVRYLTKLHGLPPWITPDRLPGLLVEKSAGLVLL